MPTAELLEIRLHANASLSTTVIHSPDVDPNVSATASAPETWLASTTSAKILASVLVALRPFARSSTIYQRARVHQDQLEMLSRAASWYPSTRRRLSPIRAIPHHAKLEPFAENLVAQLFASAFPATKEIHMSADAILSVPSTPTARSRSLVPTTSVWIHAREAFADTTRFARPSITRQFALVLTK